MISFYLLPDEAAAPSAAKLEEQPIAGELSEKDFANLQQNHLIEGRLDYATGFRWSSKAVKSKLPLLLQQSPQLRMLGNQTRGPEQRLLLILLNASAADLGLFAVAE